MITLCTPKASNHVLMKILKVPKPKINLSEKKIKEVKKDFSELRYGFSKSKISEFRRSLYNIKNQKNIFIPEIKETEKNLLDKKNIFITLRSIMVMIMLSTNE